NIQFGCYTSALNEDGEEEKCVNDNTNYAFATTFYADHVLNREIHAMIIDDVHELNPDQHLMLSKVRQSLINKNLLKLVILSGTLTSERRSQLEEYFACKNLKVHRISVGQSPFESKLAQPGSNDLLDQ
ncbi:hypothetical protein PENTCL1PPCAC_8068, partial [Pristionchus entomophagus]